MTKKLLYIQCILLGLIVLTRFWGQWTIDPLSVHLTAYQTKLFMYDWVPMLINCSIILFIAVLSYYKKPLAFLLTAIILLQYLATAIGCLLEIPQGGSSYFLIKFQLFATFTVIAFILSIIGMGNWFIQRKIK